MTPTVTPSPSGTGITATATQNPPTPTPTPTPSPSACASSTITPTPGAGNGTDLTFTFPGAAPCLMSVVRNDGCQVSTTSYLYHFIVVGTVNGTLYTFVLITAAYFGPRTYTANWVVALNVGDTASSTGNGWRAPSTGTVTVNGDEMSGSVDALLNYNVNTSGTVQVTGTWMCSTLQRS